MLKRLCQSSLATKISKFGDLWFDKKTTLVLKPSGWIIPASQGEYSKASAHRTVLSEKVQF